MAAAIAPDLLKQINKDCATAGVTVSRLVLTVIFVATTAFPWAYAFTVGLFLFSVASITDWLDGKIARERNLVTAFGQLMDPLADKVLMAAAFITLMEKDLMPGWLVIAILAREFLVTGLRLVAGARGAVLAADKLGKQKTIWQIATACYLLVYLASREEPLAWVRRLGGWARRAVAKAPPSPAMPSERTPVSASAARPAGTESAT